MSQQVKSDLRTGARIKLLENFFHLDTGDLVLEEGSIALLRVVDGNYFACVGTDVNDPWLCVPLEREQFEVVN